MLQATNVLAQLIEKHSNELADSSAIRVITLQIPNFYQILQPRLKEVLLSLVEAIRQYMQSGSTEEWRGFIRVNSTNWFKEGCSIDNLNQVYIIVLEEIEALVLSSYKEDHATRDLYVSRLKNLTTLAKITAFNVYFLKKYEEEHHL